MALSAKALGLAGGVALVAAMLALQGCKKPGAAATPASAATTTVTTTTVTPAAAAPVAAAVSANGMPAVGTCTTTTVSLVGSRLDGAPDSGSAIQYADGKSQVSYDQVPGIQNSQVGDPVQMCVAELPTNCPPGDNRGIVYSVTNQRTGDVWKEADSEHSCGGA